MNTNKSVKLNRFILKKSLKKLYKLMTRPTYSYKSNNIKIGVNDMTVNYRERCVR